MVSRLVIALAYGVATFIIVYIVGLLIAIVLANVGGFIEQIAGIVGLLVAIVIFVQGRRTIV